MAEDAGEAEQEGIEREEEGGQQGGGAAQRAAAPPPGQRGGGNGHQHNGQADQGQDGRVQRIEGEGGQKIGQGAGEALPGIFEEQAEAAGPHGGDAGGGAIEGGGKIGPGQGGEKLDGSAKPRFGFIGGEEGGKADEPGQQRGEGDEEGEDQVLGLL